MNKAGFFSLVDTLLADNVTGAISAADLRNILKSLGEKLYDDDQVSLVRTSQTSLTLGAGSKSLTFVEATGNVGFIAGSRVLIANSSSNWMAGTVTAVSTAGMTVTVDSVNGTGTYTAWTIGLAGMAGLAGTNAGAVWQFAASTTDADPGNGKFAFNSGTIGSVTQLYVDLLDVDGNTLTTFLDALDDSTNNTVKGYLMLKAVGGTNLLIFSVSAVTTATGYRKVTVAYVSGSLPSAGANYSVTFARAGDTGGNGTNGSNADMIRSSATSVAIGTGSKTLTYSSSPNLGWIVGSYVRVANSASNWMEGTVTAVSATSVTVNVTRVSGSGTMASWNVAIAAEPNDLTFGVNQQAGNYTSQASDYGNTVEHTGSTAANHTVPVGTTGKWYQIDVSGTGQITLVQGSGLTLVSRGNAFKSAGQHAMITVYYRSSTVAVVSGDLTV